MSTQNLQTILKRAVKEAEFRGLLFRDSSAALAGYDLTDAEGTALKALTPENFDAMANELESRVSMGIVWGDNAIAGFGVRPGPPGGGA